MKEVTYEDWQKNPTPRVMWCWNSNVENKVRVKVIYVIKSDAYSVITLTDNDVDIIRYKHCAEIEKQIMLEKEAEDFLKKSLKVDDDEFDFFKNEASCKEEIKRLTDFIEPREKRIAELEKENAELKSELSTFKTSDC